jgi:hypothetical protein
MPRTLKVRTDSIAPHGGAAIVELSIILDTEKGELNIVSLQGREVDDLSTLLLLNTAANAVIARMARQNGRSTPNTSKT